MISLWKGLRYRLYTIGEDGRPHGIAEAPDAQGIGVALVTLAEENRLAGNPAPQIGVLDWEQHRWLSSAWPTRNSLPF